MRKVFNALALCAVGAERAVSNELRKMEIPVIASGFGRVRFQGDAAALYLALMGLRAADRVLLEAGLFPAGDFDALFEGVRSIPWEDLIPKGMGLAVVKVRSNRSRLSALTSIQGVSHKAAAERLCGKWGLARLPEGGQGETAELRVYLEKDQASLLLDLSGDPLFKRGYRVEGGIAPLRETTAAAILLLGGWRRKFPLWDPFCGSGTVAIEAALYAWDMAPGLGRSFALSQFPFGDRTLEGEVRERLLSKVDFSRTIRIFGTDTDRRALAAARANLERAYRLARGQPLTGEGGELAGHVPGLPEFMAVSMDEARPPRSWGELAGGAGCIITNPPYGRRLGNPAEAEELYRNMGNLGQHFPGWKLGVITDHPGFESFFGKKADTCREITNGAIPSFFYQYERL